LLENAVRLCGVETGAIYRFDGEVCRIAVICGGSEEFRERMRQTPVRPGRHTLGARVALERRTIHIPDVLADPEDDYPAPEVFQMVAAPRTMLGVPMMREGALLGIFSIWRTEASPFSQRQMELIETFADQAVIAIENVRLFQEIQERNAELQESNRQVIEAL